jgi:hypothetical protein
MVLKRVRRTEGKRVFEPSFSTPTRKSPNRGFENRLLKYVQRKGKDLR